MSGYPRRGKLTDEQVVKIRVEYARGYKSSYQLSAEYGLTQAGILAVVQYSYYKAAGGPRTWPGEHEPPAGKTRGHCWDVACNNPIAASGWAQRMHFCEDCFRINGGKRGRQKKGTDRQLTCAVCAKAFTYYVVGRGYRPRCCSHECGVILSARGRVKRPAELTPDRLYEMYWGRNHTLREIAARFDSAFSPDAVRLWLIADGVSLRAKNWRKQTACIFEGCGAPIFKRWNGRTRYGRHCKEHFYQLSNQRRHIYERQAAEQGGHDLMLQIGRLIAGLPEAVKVDVQQELVLAVLSGDLALPLTRESVKPYVTRMFKENADAYGMISLAAPTREGDDAQTWGERLGLS